jgi:hypothetical protein
MAALRQAQGRLEEAEELIGQAIELAGRFDERMALAMARQRLAEVHAARSARQRVRA